MYWREAQFEQAKATLAKQNNIAPKGVVYDTFPRQHDERQKRTQSAKERVESEKQRTATARENWLKIQNQADTENGHAGVYWDPMASKASGGTTTSKVPEKPAPPPEKPEPAEQPKSEDGAAPHQ